ncbi:MAG TPA: type II toxin-antitoxin system VapC family toxin [Terracidiphilus sp.]|nr:type II toxin-antitoxin system VapC family toxin [Terracidiphilus sp.]
MSGYLLDTNAALFALVAPERLSAAARKAILKGPNVLSVVSYWEVLLKSMKGALDVGDPRAWWNDALEELAATALALKPEYVAGVYGLAAHHKDPFDRVLIAQAKSENLALVTNDALMARYASAALKVVR